MKLKIKNFLFGLIVPFGLYISLKSNLARRIEYSDSEKTLIYECSWYCGGLADRLKGIFSTYALSLILKRKFIIKLEDKCKITDRMIPNQIDWRQYVLSSRNFTQSIQLKKKVYRLLYNHSIINSFKKIDIFEFFPKDVDEITISVGLNFIDHLSINPYVQNSIRQLGYNSSSFKLHFLVHKLYKYLFKLNDKIEKKYGEILKKLRPTNNTNIICAQVRVSDADNITFISLNQTIEYWKFINSSIIHKKREPRKPFKYKVFVTTDTEDVKKEAKTFFGEKNVVTTKNSAIHITKDMKKINGNCNYIDNVILDFHLLQNCDYAVVSQSGFGVLGVWNRPLPQKNMYVYTDQENMKKSYYNRRNFKFYRINNLETFKFQ